MSNVQFSPATTREMLIKACHIANDNYVKRNSHKPKFNVNDAGFNPNIASGIAELTILNDIQYSVLNDLQIDFERIAESFKANTDIKTVLRIPLFMGFMATGSSSYLRASAKTALLSFASTITGARNRPGLMQSLTGRRYTTASDSGYDHPAYERASKLVSLLNGGKKILASTALRQMEVALGDSGIFPSLGMTGVMLRKGEVPDLIDCPATRALVAMIENASDSDFDIWANNK